MRLEGTAYPLPVEDGGTVLPSGRKYTVSIGADNDITLVEVVDNADGDPIAGTTSIEITINDTASLEMNDFLGLS